MTESTYKLTVEGVSGKDREIKITETSDDGGRVHVELAIKDGKGEGEVTTNVPQEELEADLREYYLRARWFDTAVITVTPAS